MVTVAVVVKLLARRRAPDPGWFIDSTRAAGALTVIGTMFAVLLAFTIFYALQNYQRARDGGTMEAISVTELHNVADVLEGHDGHGLHGDLICYSRAVVDRGVAGHGSAANRLPRCNIGSTRWSPTSRP